MVCVFTTQGGGGGGGDISGITPSIYMHPTTNTLTGVEGIFDC